MVGALSRTRLIDSYVLLVLLIGSYRLYRESPGIPQMADGCYSLAVSENFLWAGEICLTRKLPRDSSRFIQLPGYHPELGYPYHFVRLPAEPDRYDGLPRYYYGYPLGSSLLSLPAVAYCRQWRGLSCFDAAGEYQLAGETAMHMRVAAMVSAATVGLFYLMSRAFLPWWPSLLIALGFATGSMVWSTMSRSLWSHTWAVFLTTAAILLLLWLQKRCAFGRRGNVMLGLSLGVLMFLLYFVRPQTVLSSLAIFIFLLLWHRHILPFVIIGAASSLLLLISWSWSTFGSLLPPLVYSSGVIDGQEPLRRLWGLLASPSRGLLLFCPYLLIFAVMLFGAWRRVPMKSLLLPIVLASAGYLALFSAYLGWHGGYCYGPRYFTDLLPWFVLLGILALSGWLSLPRTLGTTAVTCLLMLAFAWAIFVHARGAISCSAWEWNYTARTDADHVRLVTDWQHPQFLAGLTYTVHSDGRFSP